MSARRRELLAALAVVAVAGCSGGGSGAGAHASGPSGIRGTELPTFSCDAKPSGKALRVEPSHVVELLVCPVAAPEPFNRPSQPITLARGGTRFTELLHALSAPDEAHSGPGQACPAYAELVPPIVARTGSVDLLVHIPADSCGHSRPAARSALTSIINGSSATQ
jgi:hypothetical protein